MHPHRMDGPPPTLFCLLPDLIARTHPPLLLNFDEWGCCVEISVVRLDQVSKYVSRSSTFVSDVILGLVDFFFMGREERMDH